MPKLRRVSGALPAYSVFACAIGLVACARAGRQPAPAPTGAFERQWSALAQKDVDVMYIEDDRGEGLMGNVRRARHAPAAPAAPLPAASAQGVPQDLSPDEVQRVIRQNLPGVRGCFLRMAQAGDQRSGKAIVSFHVGPGGDVQDTKVDAPAFEGTSLATCVSGMVSHWAFPKSQKGGLAMSYPFVFVGG
jgi:hypothetical protein